MKKKKPIGINILGWLLVISGIIMILRFINGTQIKVFKNIEVVNFKNMFYYWWNSLSPIVGLIAGIALIKSKKWGRNLVLILFVTSTILVVANMKNRFIETKQSILASEQADFEQRKSEIEKKYKPDQQEESIEQLKQIYQKRERMLPVIGGVLFGMILLWNMVFLVYFFRPKIRRYFEEGEKQFGGT
ncbi:MAG: hypothetical protein K9L84_04720 [Candidatus Omnitrophica bacterium]|nr:hypothetical protein [Candidatus Omnitrophota bacterium]MCF7894346.1 hypothetical protein [Candidatus Omnitrophota bacterium]